MPVKREPNPARVDGGRIADACGKAFEAIIDNELEGERLAGRVAWHERHQPLFRAVGPGRFAPVRKGKADHGGMFEGGLAFAIEDKSRAAGSLARSAMLVGEVEHLDSTGRGGGLALLAVELRPPGGGVHRFVLPWDRVHWRRRGDGAGVSLDDLAGWEMPATGFLRRFVAFCPRCEAYRLRWHKPSACCFREVGP